MGGVLETLVANAGQLRATVKADTLDHFGKGYHRFKLYARRMLKALNMSAATALQPLFEATSIIREGADHAENSLAFLLPRSKWRNHFSRIDTHKDRLWIVAVMVHLRDAFRSGDIWLAYSSRYGDMKQALVPIDAVKTMPALMIPMDPETWIADRKRRLEDGLNRLAAAVRDGTLPNGSVENGELRVDRLSADVPKEAIDRALAMVLDAQAQLPMAGFWGAGQTASADGQFFSTTRQGEAMNLINAKYGSEPGLKAYTHVSDQYAPFAPQVIPATVNEAPYILDGLLMNEAGRKVKEQYADTGRFTDLVFAATSLLGYMFIPGIRDLPSKRLHVFEPKAVPTELKGLTGDRIREATVIANWPDVLRAVATMLSGKMRPSQLLKKLAARQRQNDLAIALREIGRVERTLFIIEWALDINMQRRANLGLNKGEAHHALKSALRIGRQGEIRDRTAEGQHCRIAGLNLLTAIIICWNTKHLGNAVAARERTGLECPPKLLAHISPLGWAYILLTGEYRWRKMMPENP